MHMSTHFFYAYNFDESLFFEPYIDQENSFEITQYNFW